MLTILIALIAGVASGTMVGTLLSWWLLKRRLPVVPAEHIEIDPLTESAIRRAATDWAEQKGRPGMASLAADKFRLLYLLNQRRFRRQMRETRLR